MYNIYIYNVSKVYKKIYKNISKIFEIILK